VRVRVRATGEGKVLSVAAWKDRDASTYYTLTFLDSRPEEADIQETGSLAEKVSMLKDALLDAAEFPVYAVWKDASIAVTNRAGWDLIDRPVPVVKGSRSCRPLELGMHSYTADFSRRLAREEQPILKVCRLEGELRGEKLGLLTETGRRLVYDVDGRKVCDENGRFMAALLSFRDEEEMRKKRHYEEIKSEQRFRNICDCMPQMVSSCSFAVRRGRTLIGSQIWTTKPDGEHDYFSQQWYEYTGATLQECIGSVRTPSDPFFSPFAFFFYAQCVGLDGLLSVSLII
jgi:PAS domain-containing protein